ncbi:MAG TPA: GNAT family N-acetyltransferase [Kiloniellaceae bacterium]
MEERTDIVTKPTGFADWTGLLALLRESYAFMDGRIDPSSSLHRFNAAKLAAKARDEELVLAFVNSELAGCLFAAPRKDSFYLGKIAVRPGLQGRGLARRMIALAEAGARSRNLKSLDLQTRIELTENHRAFVALGFAKVGETCHAGFTRPTSVTFRKTLSA